MTPLDSFPRKCNDNIGCGNHSVLTKDLLRACPTWRHIQPSPFEKAMIEFRKRWSYKVVEVALPRQPDYGDPILVPSLIECNGGWLWKVTGPDEFIKEINEGVEIKPSERVSMYLCRHEVLDFDPLEMAHDFRCNFALGVCDCDRFEKQESISLGFSILRRKAAEKKIKVC